MKIFNGKPTSEKKADLSVFVRKRLISTLWMSKNSKPTNQSEAETHDKFKSPHLDFGCFEHCLLKDMKTAIYTNLCIGLGSDGLGHDGPFPNPKKYILKDRSLTTISWYCNF